MLRIKKYLRGIKQLPVTFNTLTQLARYTFDSDLKASELKTILQKRFAKISSENNLSSFPRVSKIEIDGRDFYLRLYPVALQQNALRYLWASAMSDKTTLDLPKIEQVCFTSVGGLFTFALLEHPLSGTEMGGQRWNPSLARHLGVDLAKWHAIPKDEYSKHQKVLVQRDTNFFKHQIARECLPGRQPTQEQSELIRHAKHLMDGKDFFNHLRVSHGDINPHNIIARENGHIGWIDLDMISIQTIWYDLSAIMCKILLRESAGSVIAFEQGYFARKPELYEEWNKLRHQWLFVYNVLEGVRWLATDRSKRLGSQVLGDDLMPYKWATRFFAQAAIASNFSRLDQDSAQLVEKMRAA